MQMPYEYVKQYQSTENFVASAKKKLNWKIALLIFSFLLTVAVLMAMIIYEGPLFLLFLLCLAWLYMCFSKMVILKKRFNESKLIIKKFDTYTSAIDDFIGNFKYPLTDYHTTYMIKYFIRSNKEATTETFFALLVKLDYKPIIDFYVNVSNGNLNSDEILKLRNEHFMK